MNNNKQKMRKKNFLTKINTYHKYEHCEGDYYRKNENKKKYLCLYIVIKVS